MQIGLEAAFSSEALGYRLLERCKLSPDQQRIVLVGSQQSFEYELVRESLLLQFPEGKAPPPLFGAPSPHQGTTPKGTPKGNPKGGKAYRPKTTYVTEDPDGEEEAADEEEDEPYEGEDAEGEEEPDDEVEALAAELETLTVTVNKLKSLTQARRFGAPSGKGGGKSIDQRKAVTQCKICGQTGHWHRECPNNKGGTKPPAPTKGKGAHKGTSGKPGKPGMRQVHVTEETEAPDEEHEAFFVYAVLYRCPEVMLASASTSPGYMIVDTACQRTCHGQGWMEQHLELLKAKGQTWLPEYRSCEKTDWFQFGAGGPVKATGIARLPCATDGKHYLIDSCELTAGIPMLGSLKLLKALGTVLDLPT